MDFKLDSAEVRVLGALLEKEITTPEYYPLTLNALVNACNQKSNREPIVSYDEETVERALETLRAKRLALKLVAGSGSRVNKHAQRFSETFNLGRRELALLCVLMLRGPQTVGELRDRTERMHDFADLSEVESCLQRLMDREPDPIVMRLPRLPGTKEPRYAHLLAGEVDFSQPPEPAAKASPDIEQRLSALETEVRNLKQELADFRKQFE